MYQRFLNSGFLQKKLIGICEQLFWIVHVSRFWSWFTVLSHPFVAVGLPPVRNNENHWDISADFFLLQFIIKLLCKSNIRRNLYKVATIHFSITFKYVVISDFFHWSSVVELSSGSYSQGGIMNGWYIRRFIGLLLLCLLVKRPLKNCRDIW